jgi:ABC-2 type transport system ATP-binding protein
VGDMIRAEGLVKRFGEVQALAGIDLAVPEGTVLGVLGPNGAGKTTAVRILTTLLKPDGGRATVAGVDVVADPAGVRERIGLSGQSAAVDEYLTGFENLDMVGQLYGMSVKASRTRAAELLEQFALTEAGGRIIKTYSGGMRRRLDLAAALVARPPVLFLDEPTTGLDPRSRNDLWGTIRDLVGRGTTLLLTTQYLEEADQLADDIVVMDHGRIIAQGDADELKARVGGERIEVVVADAAAVGRGAELLRPIASGEVQADEAGRRLVATVAEGAGDLRRALDALDDAGIGVLEFGLRRPTLDDVFLTLTGQALQDGPDAAAPAEEVVA